MKLPPSDIAAKLSEIEQTPNPTVAQCELRARIHYLQGRYAEAIQGFIGVIGASWANPIRRHRARRHLSLAYFQSNDFGGVAKLPLRDPLTRLMRSVTGKPNQIIWGAEGEARLAFLQDESWQLPQVAMTANGERAVAKIDTGGDLLSLPWASAARLGVEPVATATGFFAGGQRAKVGYGILDQLQLDTVEIRNVPVSINSFDHPLIGTGLLRQFRPTLDYPNSQLVLRPRTDDCACGGFPFLLAGTHLLLADGTVNRTEVKMLIDSGLEVTNEAGFLAPKQTLMTAGIAMPVTSPLEGLSGAGKAQLNVGEFTVEDLTLGNTSRANVIGLTGIFPRQLARPSALGFPIGGLVSHGFLRHYVWTIDFDCMRMTLDEP